MKPEEFKKIQKLAGLNNQQVADKLRVSLSLVEKWRMGKKPITEHMAMCICLLIKK